MKQKCGMAGLDTDDGFVSIGWNEWVLRFGPLVDESGSVKQIAGISDPDYLRLGDAHVWAVVPTDDGEGFEVSNGWDRGFGLAHYLTEVAAAHEVNVRVWDEPWTSTEEQLIRRAISEWQVQHRVVEGEVSVDDFEDWFADAYPEGKRLAAAGVLFSLIVNRFEDLTPMCSLDDCERVGDQDD